MRDSVSAFVCGRQAQPQRWLIGLMVGCFSVLVACGGTTQQVENDPLKVGLTGGAGTISPEIADLDRKLSALESRSKTLNDKVSKMRGLVSENSTSAELQALRVQIETGRTYLEIDRDANLSVNGITMGREDFQLFAEQKGNALCQPVPLLVVDPQADYEMVAWVLEQVYAQRCVNVEIREQAPGSIAEPSTASSEEG